MHLLIVDDDVVALELLEGELTRQGYDVSTACCGAQALEIIRRRRPDAILLDVMMPDIHGHEICRRIKADDALRTIPILLMSARNQEEDIVQGLDAGADDYITKPVNLRIAAARVRSAVRAKQDADRIRHMNETLNQARLLAEAASTAKSRFLANMSHELRTPLTAIRGFLDLMSDVSEDVRQREILEVVRRNADYLLELIDDILHLARIEADRLDLAIVPCSVRDVVSDVAALMWVRARAKNIALVNELDDDLPSMIETDPLRLRQVLVNLVGNAVKFNQGEVWIRTRFATIDGLPHVVIEVTDTGVGVAPSDLEHIFEPFAQADSSVSRRFGGTGLGLPISRGIVEKLGGRIVVESALGVGSTFCVVLPCKSADPNRQESGAATRAFVEPKRTDASTRRRKPLPALHCRVLLAEDGPDNQRLISLLLSKAGAEVALALDGREAVAKALTETFDVILMDMHMPHVDGYTATRRLRAAGYAGPIVALTANAMEGDRERCLAAGCDDYLSKPIDRHVLLEAVARHARHAPPCEPTDCLAGIR